jgi:hypothetical protein
VGAFDGLDSGLLAEMHDVVLAEVSETSDFGKVVASLPVFVGFLAIPSLRTSVVGSVLKLLTHPWPRIRSLAAQQFFEFVISSAQFVDDATFEKLTEVLSITQWDTTDRANLDGGLATLCTLLNASLPTTSFNSTIVDADEAQGDFGYDALVNEVGY